MKRGIQCIQQSGRCQQPQPPTFSSTPSSLSPSQSCARTHSGISDHWQNTDTKGPMTTLGLVPQLCSNSVRPTEAVGSSLWHGLALSGSSFSTGIPACPLHCLHSQFSAEWRDVTWEKVQLRNSSCSSAGSQWKLSCLFTQIQICSQQAKSSRTKPSFPIQEANSHSPHAPGGAKDFTSNILLSKELAFLKHFALEKGLRKGFLDTD